MATEQITDDELLALRVLANTRGGVKLGSSVLLRLLNTVAALRRQLEERTNCAPEFDVNKLDGLEGATLDNHGQDKDNIMDTTVTRPSVPKIAAALRKGIGHRFGENHWKRVSSSISQERLDAEAHERRLIPSPDRLRLPFSL